MANVSKWDIVLVICAGIGIIAGFSGFFAFLFILKNIQAGIWAFISGIFAVTYLLLLILQIRGTIDEWYATSHLCRLIVLGSLGIICSSTAFISYIAIAVHNHEQFPTMESIKSSHYIMAVWAGLTLKWSLTMTLYARTLNYRLRGGYQSI